MASQSAVMSAVLTALMQEVFNHQRRVARRMRVPSPQPGAVTFVQRLGSSLILHPHVHAIVPDAVFTRADNGSVAQIPLPTPSPADLMHLAHRMAICVHRVFECTAERGPLAELAAGAGDEDDDE